MYLWLLESLDSEYSTILNTTQKKYRLILKQDAFYLKKTPTKTQATLFFN